MWSAMYKRKSGKIVPLLALPKLLSYQPNRVMGGYQHYQLPHPTGSHPHSIPNSTSVVHQLMVYKGKSCTKSAGIELLLNLFFY